MLPSRIIYQAWFKPDVVDHGYHHCICGIVCQQDIKAGYMSLLQHPKAAHNGCENVTNPNGTLQPAITEFLKLDKSDSLDKWANWIVVKALPISFCEAPHTRACTKLPRVSRGTLKTHLFAIMQKVEAFIGAPPMHLTWFLTGERQRRFTTLDRLLYFPGTSAIPAGRVLLAFSP
ncbi:hypothetical protein PI124_g9491 [Phytophthora idaei]|nr:hypothetical protein PI125_g8684 [Phytophthora idaei]KAG3245803.1 hypothetical protein PI124_g9491 [Phytophthora idaei]